MRLLTLCAISCLLAGQASAEVERLVAASALRGANRGQEAIVKAVFANGHELRKSHPGAPISDDRNYVILPGPDGEPRLLELKATVVGLTSEFSPEHFVRLFEITGEANAVNVYNPKQAWRIRARNGGVTPDWVDPALNQ